MVEAEYSGRRTADVGGSCASEEPEPGPVLVGGGADGKGCVGAVMSSSLGGVRRWFGVVEREDPTEEVSGDR